MIELSRKDFSSAGRPLRSRVIGVGGAGSNIVDRAALDGLDKLGLVSMNTDITALTSSVAGTKIQLGKNITRGLGAGGDPELGFSAAEESLDVIERVLEDIEILFICVGLGGGTGSGAAPLVAELAVRKGIFVVVFATMPFTFEGRRRNQQAQEALSLLEKFAHAVICFENNRISDAAGSKTGIHDAFLQADQLVGHSIQSIVDMVSRPGMIRISLADLQKTLKYQSPRCIFGFGEGEGASAAHNALGKALKSPLIAQAKLKESVHSVIVHVMGGSNMSLAHVHVIMNEISKFVPDTSHIFFGTSIDREFDNKIRVTLLAATGEKVAEEEAIVSRRGVAAEPRPSVAWTQETEEAEEEENIYQEPFAATNEEEEFSPSQEEDARELPVAAKGEASILEEEEELQTPEEVSIKDFAKTSKQPETPGDKAKGKGAPKQEDFQFEPTFRGRFDDAEPTIVNGEDLDVPTFMRKKIKL